MPSTSDFSSIWNFCRSFFRCTTRDSPHAFESKQAPASLAHDRATSKTAATSATLLCPSASAAGRLRCASAASSSAICKWNDSRNVFSADSAAAAQTSRLAASHAPRMHGAAPALIAATCCFASAASAEALQGAPQTTFRAAVPTASVFLAEVGSTMAALKADICATNSGLRASSGSDAAARKSPSSTAGRTRVAHARRPAGKSVRKERRIASLREWRATFFESP
mmetsp:Transcript_4428/g.13972  ORF Transcript_4428/g.13972 Transcript_4428/m.13972 type:complete len:225 (+) Transcript_4428:1717-2391(+)